jgi:hypothetical protein
MLCPTFSQNVRIDRSRVSCDAVIRPALADTTRPLSG